MPSWAKPVRIHIAGPTELDPFQSSGSRRETNLCPADPPQVVQPVRGDADIEVVLNNQITVTKGAFYSALKEESVPA